jgi:predicted HTH transcriptional regulator
MQAARAYESALQVVGRPKIALAQRKDPGVVHHRFSEFFEQQTELGRLIMAIAYNEGAVTHNAITKVSGEHSRDITLELQRLLHRNLIVAQGSARNKIYTLSPELGGPAIEKIALTRST